MAAPSLYRIDTRKGRPSSPLYTFLKKAFNPGTSEKDNTERFDVLVTRMQVQSSERFNEPLRVLDLGSGDCLLLQKLLGDHVDVTSHTQISMGSPLIYVAADLNIREDGLLWRRLGDRAANWPCCFQQPILLPINFLKLDLLDRELTQNGPFDFIVLANVLHELSPSKFPELFVILLRHLSDNGRLIVLDPDADWCFSHDAWKLDTRRGLPLLEWEVEATWFSYPPIAEALTRLGFAVNLATKVERSMDLWEIVATRTSTVALDEKLVSDVRNQIRSYLERQRDAELQRYKLLREELERALQSHNEVQGELFLKMIEFFGNCASQCRRLEVLGDFQS